MADVLTHQVMAFALVLTRVAGFVVTMPVFERQIVPKTIRLGLVVALTFFWWPQYEAEATAMSSLAGLIVCAAREAVLGAGLGFLLGLVLLPARVAGSWISQELGLSMASMADPVTQQQSTVLSQAFNIIASMLFLAMDLHHSLLAALGRTFDAIPPAASRVDRGFALFVVDGIAAGHERGLIIAAPVGTLLFLITVLLFLLNRAAPQLNLFSIGLPLRLLAGFLAMLLLLPETCLLIAASLRAFIDQCFAMLN